MGLSRPKYLDHDYAFIGDDEQWHIKEDAPDWAKKEFDEFMRLASPEPDENGLITQY